MRAKGGAVVALFLVMVAAPAVGEAGGGDVTAALEAGDRAVYFTRMGTFVVAMADGKIVEEKPISGNWGCVSGPIDAAFSWNGKIYLFAGTSYWRLDGATRACASGYPKPVLGNWPGVMWDRIDTAVSYNGKAYFFRGSNYIRFDLASDRADPGYPKTIPSGWNGLWGADIDAAVTLGPGKAVFIKGAEIIDFDIVSDRATGAARPLATFLRRDPATCRVTRGAPPPFQCDLAPHFPNPNPPPPASSVPDPQPTPCPDSEEIIDGTSRIPAPPGVKFKNYKGKGCKGYDTTGRQHWPKDRTIMVQGEYATKSRTPGPKVNLVVLHETTGDRGYVSDNRTLVHFLVDDDGTIYQLMDLALYASHPSHYPVDAKSIGIEVANNFAPKACTPGRECVTARPDYANAPSHPWVLTREGQLDALDKLLQHLITRRGIDPTWLQLGYKSSTGLEHFFIGPSNATQVAPDAAPSKGNDFLCPPPRDTTGRLESAIGCGGILSHSSVNERDVDGSFPALYTGLAHRMRKTGVPVSSALVYKVAVCIARQKIVNARDPGLARQFNPGKVYKQAKNIPYSLDQLMLFPLALNECMATP
jgi:hypothetical protein